MLDQLSDKVLCKIFSKTNVATAKSCRLLNKRFNKLITEHGFNKEHLTDLSIFPTFFCQGEPSSVTIDVEFNRQKTITYNNYEELLEALPQYLEKIGKIDDLLLLQIPINETLLDMFLQQSFLSSIRKFSYCSCVVEATNEQKWFAFLERLNLDEISINTHTDESFVNFPATMLHHVGNSFNHISGSRTDLMEMPWLTDEAVLNWYTPDKHFYLQGTVTGMTIDGIIQCIQLLMEITPNTSPNFGILKNTTPDLVETALNAAGLPWEHRNACHILAKGYLVDVGIRSRVFFGCVAPRRQGYSGNINLSMYA